MDSLLILARAVGFYLDAPQGSAAADAALDNLITMYDRVAREFK